MRRILLESLALVAIVTMFVSTCVGTATASVPIIVSVENTSVDIEAHHSITESEVWIDVTISNDNPNSTHYVDWIEVDYDGSVQQFSLPPQTFSPFTVRLFLGTALISTLKLTPPQVKVRAHCTVDGWSDWSNPVPIPEFPVATIIAFTALAASLFMTRRKPSQMPLEKYSPSQALSGHHHRF